MNLIDLVKMPKGFLEIIVTDHKTGELINRFADNNQIQDWARHCLAYMAAGRLFSTYGNHGDIPADMGAAAVPHIADGSNTVITSSPWIYSANFAGMVQDRAIDGDSNNLNIINGTPIYPFFPTKMRFGIGGLDVNQIPNTTVETSVTRLQSVQTGFPFVVIDRTRVGNQNDHVFLDATSLGVNHRVTFSVKLPGGETGYPYDGYVISEAGLFCDAALTAPGNDYNMRTGAMMAYRTFYGITKNDSIDLQFNWSFLF